VSDWISVDDQLPEARGLHLAGERVLIFYSTWREILVAARVWTNSEEWVWMDEEDYVYAPIAVTHWMPLPKPPA